MVKGAIDIIYFEEKSSGNSKPNKISLKGKISTIKSDLPPIDLKNSGEQVSVLRNLLFNSEIKYLEFIKSSFKNNPVVYKGSEDRITIIKEMLFDLDVLMLLENTASDQIHVWLSQADHNNKAGPLQSLTIESANDALKLYQAGHSIYCRAPLELEKIVIPSIMKEVGMGINCNNNDRFKRGEIETFFSRKGHVTGFHTDFQENFTIQLSGKKKWSFCDSSIESPLRGCTPHFSAKNNNDLVEHQLKILKLGNPNFYSNEYQFNNCNSVELSPGDVLYHPAGVWHRVECTEDSISINISLTAASYAEVFCSNLQQILLQNDNWRSPILLSNDSSCSSHAVMQSIIDSLPSILKNISSVDLLPSPLMYNNNEKNMKIDVDDESSQEDEGDEAVLKDNIIIINEIDILSNPLYSYINKSRKGSNILTAPNFIEIIKEISFKFNPIAIILSATEVIAGGGSRYTDNDCTDVYIIHNGFGNETLESTSRMEIHIHNQVVKELMLTIMNRYKVYRELQHKLINNDTNDNISKLTDLTFNIFELVHKELISTKTISSNKNKRKYTEKDNCDTYELIAKLTIALYSVGLVSLV